MVQGHLHDVLYFKKSLRDHVLDHGVFVEAASHAVRRVAILAVDFIESERPHRVYHDDIGTDHQQAMEGRMGIETCIQQVYQVGPLQLLSEFLAVRKEIHLSLQLGREKVELLKADASFPKNRFFPRRLLSKGSKAKVGCGCKDLLDRLFCLHLRPMLLSGSELCWTSQAFLTYTKIIEIAGNILVLYFMQSRVRRKGSGWYMF